ncbi:MAG: UDP-2,3-diacylglucosamine diphosphatase [Muribaculaceae bacterium]|nr:UDP-2,3-diacylglucosamine diphosphatase [Muribaculaceae bacterium]
MRNKVYFISDLHLGARYIADAQAHEKRVVAWLESIRDHASALYLLGDILDYWYEYRYVVPKGHVRFLGVLARLVDAGVKVYWFLGNHDIWLFSYMQSEIGIEVVDGSRVVELSGKRFFLEHGDGVGHKSAGFRFIRALFRNRLAQKLFSAVHPRWTVPFAFAWSSSSRNGYGGNADIEACVQRHLVHLREFAESYPGEIDYFVFGHLHCIVDERLARGSQFVVLGDGISHFSYCEFDGRELKFGSY